MASWGPGDSRDAAARRQYIVVSPPSVSGGGIGGNAADRVGNPRGSVELEGSSSFGANAWGPMDMRATGAPGGDARLGCVRR